jgi:predicted TIM-barrel fold metal-dependent hydrolase
MSKVNELEIPIILHMGSDPLPFIIPHGNPAGLDTLSLWYPRMKMVAAHLARGYDELLTAMLWYKKNVMYADISGLQYEVMKSPWHFVFKMRYLMDKVPYAILMGSDWPWIKTPPMPTHKEWFDAIRNLSIPDQIIKSGLCISDFSETERDMILGGNARALLGL